MTELIHHTNEWTKKQLHNIHYKHNNQTLTKLIIDTETNIQNTAAEHQDTLRHNINNTIGVDVYKRQHIKTHKQKPYMKQIRPSAPTLQALDVYKRQVYIMS